MKSSNTYILDRVMHWIAAFLLLFMLFNLSTLLHTVDWEIKGQLLHRQHAVETHAIVGITLLFITLARIIFTKIYQKKLPRMQPRSKKHTVFIQFTHFALYVCILLLVVSGLLMIMNYEIPISLLGVTFEPAKDNFYQFFPKVHQIHMFLQNAILWMVGIHFVGIMYMKK